MDGLFRVAGILSENRGHGHATQKVIIFDGDYIDGSRDFRLRYLSIVMGKNSGLWMEGDSWYRSWFGYDSGLYSDPVLALFMMKLLS